MAVDEKCDLTAHPCKPGVGGQHMTVAIGNVITNKVLHVDQTFPTRVTIALASCRAHPATVVSAVVLRRFLHCTMTVLYCTVMGGNGGPSDQKSVSK